MFWFGAVATSRQKGADSNRQCTVEKGYFITHYVRVD